MTLRRTSVLLHALPASAVTPLPQLDPVTAWRQVRDACRGSHQLSAPLRAWLAQAADRWLAAGGALTLDEAFRQKAKRGYRYSIAHRRARHEQALFVILPELGGTSSWTKAGELERVCSGEAAAPSTRVREELEQLRAEGLELPRTRRQLYAVIVDLLKRNP